MHSCQDYRKQVARKYVLLFSILALILAGCTGNAQPPQATGQGWILGSHLNPLSALAFSPDGKILASGSQNTPYTQDNSVFLWNPAAVSTPVTPGILYADIRSLAFSSDGRYLAAGGAANSIFVWDLNSRNKAPLVITPPSESNVVVFKPDTHTIISGDQLGNILLWNLDQTIALTSPSSVLSSGTGAFAITSLAISSDGGSLVSAGGTGEIRLWHLRQSTITNETLNHENHRLPPLSVSISADGTVVAAGNFDGAITVWRIGATSTPVVTTIVPGETNGASGPVNIDPANSIEAVVISSDGTHLAAAGLGKIIRIWELSDPNKEPVLLSGHKGGISALAYSPDNSLLTSASSSDGTIRIWRVK